MSFIHADLYCNNEIIDKNKIESKLLVLLDLM